MASHALRAMSAMLKCSVEDGMSMREWLRCAAVSTLLLGATACARAPQTAVRHAQAFTPDQEARAIEAAKRHPIAQPRVRPAYPEQSPPPLPVRTLPAQSPPPLPAYAPASGPPSFATPAPIYAPAPMYDAPPPVYSAPYGRWGVEVYHDPWYSRRYRWGGGWGWGAGRIGRPSYYRHGYGHRHVWAPPVHHHHRHSAVDFHPRAFSGGHRGSVIHGGGGYRGHGGGSHRSPRTVVRIGR